MSEDNDYRLPLEAIKAAADNAFAEGNTFVACELDSASTAVAELAVSSTNLSDYLDGYLHWQRTQGNDPVGAGNCRERHCSFPQCPTLPLPGGHAMSLSRDEMAVRLLAGILANPAFVNEPDTMGSIHAAAVYHADESIAELARTQPAKGEVAATRYPWGSAPEWAMWAATDADGGAWWYDTPPDPEDDCWSVTGVRNGKCFVECGTRCPDWKASLEARPTSRE